MLAMLRDRSGIVTGGDTFWRLSDSHKQRYTNLKIDKLAYSLTIKRTEFIGVIIAKEIQKRNSSKGEVTK